MIYATLPINNTVYLCKISSNHSILFKWKVVQETAFILVYQGSFPSNYYTKYVLLAPVYPITLTSEILFILTY